MKLTWALVVGLGVCAAWADAGSKPAEIPAVEVRVRSGAGNFLGKLAAGKPVAIAYLGGSITDMSGWRNLTTEWFRKQYPGADIREIHASIAGTGSYLGAFRLGHDALGGDPDLVFVEFATNDGSGTPQSIHRSMEGIVRQIWRHNPETDIVFAYTITTQSYPFYRRGVCQPSAAAMETVAEHYGIPSVNFGPRVAAEVATGRLVMSLKDAERETAVPAETPELDKVISAELAKQGKILFAKDGVHPAMSGHAFYLQSITNAFAQMKGLASADHAARLAAAPVIADNLENAKMVDLPASSMKGTWNKLPPDRFASFRKRMGDIYQTSEPGASLSFKFRGRRCAIYDIVGPDGGQVWITVDGRRSAKPTPRFDSYCTYHRIAQIYVYDGKDGVHEVTITVDKDQPSRQSVAFRLKDPKKELATPKYNGTNFWPAKIMIDGDLCE